MCAMFRSHTSQCIKHFATIDDPVIPGLLSRGPLLLSLLELVPGADPVLCANGRRQWIQQARKKMTPMRSAKFRFTKGRRQI